MDANHLKKYWQLYAFVAYVIVQWTVFGGNIEANTQRIDGLEERQQEEEIILLDIRTQLASINTSLEFIKQELNH